MSIEHRIQTQIVERRGVYTRPGEVVIFQHDGGLTKAHRDIDMTRATRKAKIEKAAPRPR